MGFMVRAGYRRGLLAVGIAAALAWVGVGLGHAGAKRLNSFAGSCSVQGTVRFSPPVTNFQQHLAVSYDAAGVCSGELNGKQVSNAPVELFHAGNADASCMRAQTTGPGKGAITFANGTVIPYTFEFTDLLTEVDFTFRGQRSGFATGHGTFLAEHSDPQVVLQCAGEGAPEAAMDMSLTTESPLVSKRQGGSR